MVESGQNTGGLGLGYTSHDYQVASTNNTRMGALEWNVLGSAALVAVATLLPYLPKPVRLLSFAGSVVMGANAALIFQNEINRPTSNSIS